MTKWLRKIAALLKEIPADFQVDLSALSEKEEGDKEKGALSQETSALFRLLHWLKEGAQKRGEEHEKVCAKDGGKKCKEFQCQASMESDDIDVIRDIFFSSIREELKLNSRDYPNIAIRKGGVVVAIPKQETRSAGIEIISIGSMGRFSLMEALADLGKKPR